MNTACEGFRNLHELEQSGELTARQFARLDRHREACSSCLALARQADPLGLFRVLSQESRDDVFWTGTNRALRAGIREEGRLGPAESLLLLRPAYRVALAAVLVLALGLVAGVLSPSLEVPPAEAPEAMLAGGAPGEVMLPTVESIQSEDATVYEMKVFGEEDQVIQVVMIFDDGIDL
jgi:hypothetical protein